jgi:hypothetical protein
MIDHRAKVRECLEEAQNCRTSELREVLLRMCLVWDTLATKDGARPDAVMTAWGRSPFWSPANAPASQALQRVRDCRI